MLPNYFERALPLRPDEARLQKHGAADRGG